VELSYLSATFLFSVGGRPVGAGRWRAMPSSKWGQNEDERRKNGVSSSKRGVFEDGCNE